MAKNKKIVPPFVLRKTTGYGFSNTDYATLLDITDATKQIISEITALGYTQVKQGAYLYWHTNHSLTVAIKVFDANNQLVTHEILRN